MGAARLQGDIFTLNKQMEEQKITIDQQQHDLEALNVRMESEASAKDEELIQLRSVVDGAREKDGIEANLTEELKLAKLKLEKAKKLIRIKEDNLNKIKSDHDQESEDVQRQLESERVEVANLKSTMSEKDELLSSLQQKVAELGNSSKDNETLLIESTKTKAQLEKLKSLSKNKISNLLSEKEELAKQVEEIGRSKDILLVKEKADEEIIE